jgi:hypothetical protein
VTGREWLAPLDGAAKEMSALVERARDAMRAMANALEGDPGTDELIVLAYAAAMFDAIQHAAACVEAEADAMAEGARR